MIAITMTTGPTFFLATQFTNFYNPTLEFKRDLVIASNVSGVTAYFGLPGKLNDANDPFNRPYPDPFIIDAAWDMGRWDGIDRDPNIGRIDVYGSRVGAGSLGRILKTGLQLHHPDGNMPIN